MAADVVKVFDPELVSMIVGTKTMGGFADGTFIVCERITDTFTDTVGADREVARFKTGDSRGNINITLMQSSTSNGILSTFQSVDELSGTGVFPVLFKDGNGKDVAAAAICWVVKPANMGVGKENQNREWTVRCANLIISHGGIAAVKV